LRCRCSIKATRTGGGYVNYEYSFKRDRMKHSVIMTEENGFHAGKYAGLINGKE
jgi:hypothetical protein